MKKILSYVLWGNEGRYWGNVPYILVANSSIYPDFIMRFYVHRDAASHSLFSLLETLADKFENVELEVVGESYSGTQLTTWRMKPLWEEDVELLFCRDLDYIINAPARQSVQYFLNHPEHLIHNMRSYHLHTAPYMAGLCGFRCPQVRQKIEPFAASFLKYIEWGQGNVAYCRDWRWGCDQALLRDFFGHCGLYPFTMDCPQFTAPEKIYGYNPVMVKYEVYQNIGLPTCNVPVLAYSDFISPSFTGQPVTATTDQVQAMIEIVNNEMGEAVKPYV